MSSKKYTLENSNYTPKNGPQKICSQNGKREFYPKKWALENILSQKWEAEILPQEYAPKNILLQNRE